MDNLSKQQRAIVHHPHDQGHLLVLAGPGSGKTRVITERVSRLLSSRVATPEQILIMTFTLKAAAELVKRLEQRLDTQVQGIWAGTFHSICNNLLREHGSAIGWDPSFTICDTPRQDLLLRQAAGQVGWVLDDPRLFQQVKASINERKLLGLRGDEQRWQPPYDAEHVLAIDESYRRLLKDQRALDYNDLIINAIQLLQDDANTAERVRHRFRYLYIDEFHDISPDQFALLTALAPARMPEQQVMIVADQNQAIYGWRKADPTRMLSAYQQQYQPTRYRLEENYRSTGNLVRAAQQLIGAGGATAAAVAVLAESQQKIDCVSCPTSIGEAQWLARQIIRAQASGYPYRDIAVLYRTHQRADAVEAAFVQAGIPVDRKQANRFFDDPDVQATLRYLALIAALRDESFEPALNWPRVLVDELTMVHLHRLASANGLTLSTLARQIDGFADQISPLTRVAITEFLDTIGTELLAIADQPIESIVDHLLTLLERRRSPLPATIRASLLDVWDFLARPLHESARRLHDALVAGRSLVIQHDRSLDSGAAALILEHILTHYLQASVVVQERTEPYTANAFVITCSGGATASSDGISIGIRDARSLRYSISTQAWRLGQLVLMRYETLRRGTFRLYDLETTGTHVNTTEILELAALETQAGLPTEHTFHSLVRPEGPISADATHVHGLSLRDVRDAPTPEQIMPAFLDFLGDATLVGHNIEQFDHPILRRIALSLTLPAPANPLIDTCTLARRLLPGQSHRLEDLAQQFKIPVTQTHRALDDVRLNAQVFEKLLDVMDQDREIEIASEVLPLVALGIIGSGVPQREENTLVMDAGARAYRRGLGDDLLQRLNTMVDPCSQPNDAVQWFATAPLDTSEDDHHWVSLTARWRNMLQGYSMMFSDQSLQGFLAFTALASSIDYQHEDQGRVTMMTIHTAKGMEWPLVFIIGAEDDMLPSYLSRTPDAIEEDRRVLYVGMTRAKVRLCISWAAERDNRAKKPSRFLQDLPADLVTQRVIR